jgi:DNA-binding response OmpR family regulator
MRLHHLTFPQPLPFCMVIDPSVAVRKILATELQQAHYPLCATFADPLEAMRAIALNQIRVPDIVVVSWRLPKFDGVEVLRQMKHARYHTAGVMLLDKDQNSPLMHVKAQLAGAQKALAKPFTMQAFLNTIAAVRYTY